MEIDERRDFVYGREPLPRLRLTVTTAVFAVLTALIASPSKANNIDGSTIAQPEDAVVEPVRGAPPCLR